MVLGDFHLHSTFSDGRLSISQLVDTYGQRGFGCIAITDHLCETNTFLGKAAHYLDRSLTKEKFSLYMATIAKESRRAWEQYRMLVIPGVEITKNAFLFDQSIHFLLLGLHEYIDPGLDIITISEQARKQGALVVAAHPVSTRRVESQTLYLWNNRERLTPYFDAWEVASGPVLFPEVSTSDLPKLANSDLHHPKQITSWKSVVHSERTMGAVLHGIRNQDLSFVFYKDSVNETLQATV